MAKGKFKAKAESQRTTATVEELSAKVEQLTEENAKLKAQAEQDARHHAFQIAQMHEHLTQGTAPEIELLREENLTLKRALRGEPRNAN